MRRFSLIKFSVIGSYEKNSIAFVLMTSGTTVHDVVFHALRKHVLQLANGPGSLLVHEQLLLVTDKCITLTDNSNK